MWAKLNHTYGHSAVYNNLKSYDLHQMESSKNSGASGKVLAQVGQELTQKLSSLNVCLTSMIQKAYIVTH